MTRFKILFLFVVFAFSCGDRTFNKNRPNRNSPRRIIPEREPSTPLRPTLSEEDHQHEEICTHVMEKTKGESGDNLLILSEDDFAVSSGGLPINMIFKKKITEGFFEHFDGILIKFNDTLSVLKDFHPTSRSLRFMANEELELLDRCYQAYKEEESHLIYFYQKSVISEKMSQSHELKQRDLMFRSLNIANRPLNIVFPIQNIGENKT